MQNCHGIREKYTHTLVAMATARRTKVARRALGPDAYDAKVAIGPECALGPPRPMQEYAPPGGLERFVLIDAGARTIRVQLPHGLVLMNETVRKLLGEYLAR